jgi:parallel beta-helix repeat protein
MMTVSFYVAPNGKDTWSGKIVRPNTAETDGPFATLQRAFEAVAELKDQKGGVLDQPVTIYLRGGIYFLSKPIVITPEHSGTELCPITVEAYQNEKPIISGGKRISGWKEVEVNGKQLWATEIPEVKKEKWFFHQLWVNGKRATRARHPNQGYLRVAEVLDVNSKTPWYEGQTRFRFFNNDLKAWPTISDAEVVVMNRWVESHLPILSIDESKNIVSTSKRSVFQLEPGDLYYVENALEFLDKSGEWYLDQRNGLLYYMPRVNENIEQAEVIAPKLPQVIQLVGKPEEGRWVEHITFHGITFSHTEWYFPEDFKLDWPSQDVGGFPQAAVGVPGAVYGKGIRNVTWNKCRVVHVGTYGIELARGCQNNAILSCEISDLGAGGIKIGETQISERKEDQNFSNRVEDCYIHNGGLIFHSAVGVWIGQSYNNYIAHNEIADFYYTGISVGWTWGYGPSLAGGNCIEWNYIHHIGKRSDGDGPILSDMGGIYTLGIQRGTKISNNLIHDVSALRYGGWGIYLDEGSTGILVENNIVYNTTHGGFHQHYGKENMIRNNIFAYGRDCQLQASRSEAHLRFRFENNIVVGKTEKWLTGSIDFNFIFEKNLYWREDGKPIKFGDLSWDEWRKRGMDNNSLFADPLFVNSEGYDFRLKSDSPALMLGFHQIDLSKIGPRKFKVSE